MQKNKKPEISIIIPTKNEEDGIAKVIVSIPERIRKISEIIVVDNSTDLTPKIAKALGAKVIKVKKPGKGYAMKIGAKKAKGEILVFLDGDGADSPIFIPRLVKKIKEGYDLVLGARYLKSFKEDDKISRFIFGYIWRPLVLTVFGMLGWPGKGDPLSGFRALRKETWNKMKLKTNNFEIETEMNLKAIDMNLKIYEIPVPCLKRAGKSKFIFNIPQWFAIFNLLINYIKDRKLRSF